MPKSSPASQAFLDGDASSEEERTKPKSEKNQNIYWA